VAIVGAGPAGSAAAIWCALAGLRVALLEADSVPGRKPGESLHPGVLPILRQLGVDRQVEQAGFLRHPGQTVAWGHEPQYQRFGIDQRGVWFGFQVLREKFEAILLNRATELGVELFQGCRAHSPRIDGGRVVGINSTRGPIHARLTIDGAGGNNWLGRRLGRRFFYASRRLIAYYGYAKGVPKNAQSFPYLEVDQTGWTWVARLDEDLFAWSRLPFSRTTTGTKSPPSQLRDCAPIGRTRGKDVTWRFLPHSAGPGFFVVGDAAARLDPLSSHGILKALMSGMNAAHLINLVLGDDASETRATSAYREWSMDLFERDFGSMHKLYAQLPQDWPLPIVTD